MSLVSIPDWCDWQNELFRVSEHQIIVSIPDWCDWQRVYSFAGNGQYAGFNSRLVRLAVVNIFRDSSNDVFQFQIGAIGSMIPWLVQFALTGFQFQIGAIGSLIFFSLLL